MENNNSYIQLNKGDALISLISTYLENKYFIMRFISYVLAGAYKGEGASN